MLAGLWILWPVLAVAGGKGFALLGGIFGLLSAIILKIWQIPLGPAVKLYWLFFAFVLWASISALWSPQNAKLIELNFSTGDVAIRMASLRFGLIIGFTSLLCFIALSLNDGQKRFLRRAVMFGITLQLCIIIAFIVTEIIFRLQGKSEPALSLIVPSLSESLPDAYSNFTAGMICFCLTLPLALYFLTQRLANRSLLLLSALASLAYASLGWFTGTGAVVLISLICFLATCLSKILKSPKAIISFCTYFIGTLVLLAPLTFWIIALIGQTVIGSLHTADPTSISPSGFQTTLSWRFDAWMETIRGIIDRPLFGHGLDATKTIDTEYVTGPLAGTEYKIVQGHPHNMFLHIWHELGIVGALIVTFFSILSLQIIERLPESIQTYWICLLAILLTVASFSFSFWNDWWWSAANITIATMIALIQPRLSSIEQKAA